MRNSKVGRQSLVTEGYVHLLGCVTVLVILVFRSVALDCSHIGSGSMAPSLLKGDRVVVDKAAYSVRLPFTSTQLMQIHEPRIGDVISFDLHAVPNPLVKRVFAVSGDVVVASGNQISRNGSVVMSWSQPGAAQVSSISQRIVVPPGRVYVVGDDVANSMDSRHFGTISTQNINGRVVGILYSVGQEGSDGVLRAERFFTKVRSSEA